MSRLSWLGGSSTPKDDVKSVQRAQRHRRSATKADRKGWAAHDRRDRRTYGD